MTDATWEALLERFEADLSETATASEWVVPATPLPVGLADRARRIVGRQEQRMRDMHRELEDVQAQLTALRRVPAVRTDMPTLLDREL